MSLSFENTEYAFAYKPQQELKKANFLFSMMGIGWFVKMATRVTPWAIKAGFPIKGLLRKTIFEQFIGGETLEQTAKVAAKLAKFNVQVILDYAVEGKDGEENFEHATQEFLKVIKYAASQPNIPFISVKLTGIIRFGLLEKLHAASTAASAVKGVIHTEALTEEEKKEWERVEARILKISEAASQHNVGLFIDAEETWIQDPVDALSMKMMDRFNRGKVVVFNTLQLYRHDRLQFLKDSYAEAHSKGFLLGAKLVRGAYMEKERKRAEEMGYPSPIQPDKQSTDRDYNACIEFCINHLDEVYVIVASHNEYSNMYTTELMEKHHDVHNHPHVHFSQLFGMSDNITFNLAKDGYSVSKYLPFGPIEDVVPYLMRRAQENSSVSGQTGKEIMLIKKELQRRKAQKA
jgi:proline dehydrogenase